MHACIAAVYLLVVLLLVCQCLAKLLANDCFDTEAESYLLAKCVSNTQLECLQHERDE